MTEETPVDWKGKKGNEYDDCFLVGDVWQVFHFAAQKIRAKFGVSTGVSNRVLRELCASGEVQSILVTCRNGEGRPVPVRRIKPCEWRADDLDIDENDLIAEGENWVEVSMDDLEYWLDQQEELDDQEPKNTKKQAQSQRGHARRAILKLWPNGIPNTLSNTQIVSEIGRWIVQDCKENNVPNPTLSPDMILQAAGRGPYLNRGGPTGPA